MKPAVIVSTFPNEKILHKIASLLIQDKVIACVNVSSISSTYLWKGKIQNENEYLAIFKTTQKKKNILKKRLQDEHPYDVPEIAEIDVTSVNSPYMKWLTDSTS